MNNIIEKIRRDLKENSNEHTRQSGQRFFKESVNIYGVKTALVSRIAKEYIKALKTKAKLRFLIYARSYGSRDIWKNRLSPVTGLILFTKNMSPGIFRYLKNG